MSVDVLHDDKTESAPCEGNINTRGPYSRDVIVFKVCRDKVLRLGLSRGDMISKLDPDIVDLIIRLLFESDLDTADIGGGSLGGTERATLPDDRPVARNIRWLVFMINKNSEGGGHGGSRG